MIRKRASKQRVIVILEGIKLCTEKIGIAPLWKAERQVNNADDEILVLALLHAGSSFCRGDQSDHQCNQSSEDDPHIKFLRTEISQRKEVYLQIFRPFYHSCKMKGVKFQVKIAAGFRPKDIIIEEANNANATWIVMDSCFARDLSFRLSGTECNISLVSDDDEAADRDHHRHSYDGSAYSLVIEERHKPKSLELVKRSLLQQEPCFISSLSVPWPSSPSLLASTSIRNENQTMSEAQEENKYIRNMEPPKEKAVPHDDGPRNLSKANLMLSLPLQLSWEVILEITSKFSTKACRPAQCKNFIAYLGYLSEHHSFVLVKRFKQDSKSILEAEKKAALSMNHKNILGLLGYHQSDNGTVLVYPHPSEGTLDNLLCRLGQNKPKLTFQEKLKIAIGIAQGVRYMHQECSRDPIVHSELQLHNILLRHDLRPLITGFGQAMWLQLKHASSIPNRRCHLEELLSHESMELLKSDVFSFGVLLLRLFCRRSIPRDDRSLIEWARPLILQRKFHELLDEDLEVSDLHGIYRVMAAVTQCTVNKPTSRPCMSKVICILKGENFSAIQSSPSNNTPP